MRSEPLPLFDGGEKVQATSIRLTGTIDDQRAQPAGAFYIGDIVEVLCVGVVTKVEHSHTDDRLIRGHVVKVQEVLALEDGEAAVLLTEARARNQAALDELLGRRALPFDEDEGDQ